MGSAGATSITTNDDGGAAADLTIDTDGLLKLDSDGVEIENDSDSGRTALLIDNNDADQITLDIDSSTTTAQVIDIDCNNTTGNVIDVNAPNMTTGTSLNITDGGSSSATRTAINFQQSSTSATQTKGLVVEHNANTANTSISAVTIDKNHTGTGTGASVGLRIDIDQTGEVTSATHSVYGTITEIETNSAADGTVNAFGHRIFMSGDTDGTHSHTGLQISLGDADNNTHIEMNSKADPGDMCTIGVGPNGVTTITTIDDDNAVADLIFNVDGQTTFSNGGTSNGVHIQSGLHASASMYFKELGSAPAVSGEQATIYALDDSGTTKLYYKDSSGAQHGPLGAGGGGGNAFTTISVAGQDDVVADAATDTLTLVGSGLAITTNAGGDQITFTASGGGGSLDTSYNNGRQITVDAGPVELTNASTGTDTLILRYDTNTASSASMSSDGKLMLTTNDQGSTNADLILNADGVVAVRDGNNNTQPKLVFTKDSSPLATGATEGENDYFIQRTSANELNIKSNNELLLTAGNSKAVIVNDAGASLDFRVESANKPSAIMVDGGTDQIAFMAGGTTAANTFGDNAATSAIPTDVNIFFSGSCASNGIPNSKGTALFGGDLVVSGNLKVKESCSPGGETKESEFGLSKIRVGSLLAGGLSPSESPAVEINDDTGAGMVLVRSDASTQMDDVLGALTFASTDNGKGLNADAPAAIVAIATADHSTSAGRAKLLVKGQSIANNTSNVWMEMGPGPFLPDNPAAGIAPLVTIGEYAPDGDTLVQRANLRLTGHLYGSSPVSITTSGSMNPASNLNHLALVVSGTILASGSYDDKPYGTISGSVHHTRDGLPFLRGTGGIHITSMSNGQVIINSSNAGGGGMTQFYLEDDAGTEVGISNDKEVKFIGGSGISTVWSDTSSGSDADPYDMTFATTGSAGSMLYSEDGPSKFFSRPINNIKSGVLQAVSGNDDPMGLSYELRHTQNFEGVGFRCMIPHNASQVRFEIGFKGGQNGNVEFRVAGRLLTNSSRSGGIVAGTAHNTGNTQNSSGHWLDSNVDNGFRYVFTGIQTVANANYTNSCGQLWNITDLINTGDVPNYNKGLGHIIDFVIIRNRSESLLGGSTSDNLNGSVFINHITAHFS